MTDLKKEINKLAVSLEIANTGFQVEQRDCQLLMVSSIEGNDCILSVRFIPEQSGVVARPVVVISFEEVASFYNSIFGEGHYSGTLNIGLFNAAVYLEDGQEAFNRDVPDAWPIRGEADLKVLESVLPRYLMDVVIPYRNRFNSLHHVSELLNKSYAGQLVHMPFNPLRAEVGLISALLCEDPCLVDHMNRWTDVAQDWPEEWIGRITKLRKSIL